MLNLSKLLNWIKKYYKVAILPPVTVIVLVFAFLLTVGAFVGELECSDCAYGTVPEFKVGAFLSSVYYEYSSADGEELWSREIPQRAGEYKIRAVSKNGFGKPKYSKAAAFTVLPATLEFEYKDISCVYGDESKYIKEGIIPHGLIGNDRLEEIDCTFETVSEERVSVSVCSYKIVDGNGEDVTDSYKYTESDGTWRIEKRSITLKSKDAGVQYTGEPMSSGEVIISRGTLAQGDRAEVIRRASLTEVGKTENTFTIKIVNSEGEDVTKFYSLSYSYGWLNVTGIKITVTTAGAEKIYDGTPLTKEGYEIDSGSLCDGHSLSVSYTGKQTDAGTSFNTVDVKVTDASGEDVTKNYSIEVKAGQLTVTPKTLSVRSGSAKKQYDGKPLVKESFELVEGELVSGHTLAPVFTQKEAITVGDYENTFVCYVKSSDGGDVSSNYSFEYVNGTLTIEPIVLKFKTGSAEKIYDGEPLTNREYKLVSGKLAEGHSFFNTYADGSQTDAGFSSNTMKVAVIDEKGNDVTKKGYEVVVEEGTLTVTKRKATVGSGDAEKKYDGKPLTASGCWWNNANIRDNTGIINSHDMDSNVTGSQTEVGSSPNYFEAIIRENNSGKDVTKNYELIYEYGTLTVTEGSEDQDHHDPDESEDYDIMGPMPPSEEGDGPLATFRLQDLEEMTRVYLREKSYGDYLGGGWKKAVEYDKDIGYSPIFFSGTKAMSYAQVQNKYFHITMSDYCPPLIPYYVSHFNISSVVTPNKSDVSCGPTEKSYNLWIYPDINIHFEGRETNSRAEWLTKNEPVYKRFVYENYLSIPESTKEAMLYIAEENGIRADSKTLIQDIKEYISHAATYNLDIKEFPSGVDKAVYFLTVTKEGYCQHFASAGTLMYRAFGIPARFTVGFACTAYPGNQETNVTSDDAHAWVEVYIDGTGWVPVEVTASVEQDIIPDAEGNPITSDGKRVITVSTYSADKYYDGESFPEFSGDKYWISQGSLFDGHRIEVTMDDSNRYYIAAGKWTNTIKTVKIFDRSGNDVSDEYYVMFDFGTSEISKRPITIVSASASKVYDGTKLADNRFWIADGGLAPGDSLTVNVTGSRVSVGEFQNSFDYTITNIYGNEVDYWYDVTVIYGSLEVTKE